RKTIDSRGAKTYQFTLKIGSSISLRQIDLSQPGGEYCVNLAQAGLCPEVRRTATAMKPEQWQRLKDLFEAALQQEPGHRRQFLEQVCGDDIELYEEVVSLLASYEQAGSFIAAPAIEDAAHLLFDEASGPHCG